MAEFSSVAKENVIKVSYIIRSRSTLLGLTRKEGSLGMAARSPSPIPKPNPRPSKPSATFFSGAGGCDTAFGCTRC